LSSFDWKMRFHGNPFGLAASIDRPALQRKTNRRSFFFKKVKD
jgi:hypothetical protein